MTSRSFVQFYLALFIVGCLALPVDTAYAQPYTGELFNQILAAQDTVLQRQLEALLPDSAGYLVTGPFDPLFASNASLRELLGTPRVICIDAGHVNTAIELLKSAPSINVRQVKAADPKGKKNGIGGFRGSIVSLANQKTILLMTFQQLRWLSWVREAFARVAAADSLKSLNRYSVAVSEYLDQIGAGTKTAVAPKAVEYGLAEKLDLYATAPEYVIQGYENYKNFIESHSELSTDFARGILAFIPSDSTLGVMKRNLPHEAFPNKEAAMFQVECRKFFEREGDLRQIRTLSADLFRSLEPGEYFFGVGLDGTIRFGRELLREEVERIEKESGKKLARANHAFLFGNEPLLAAGAFFIERDSTTHLSHVTAQSGHYFYSNISSSVKEDVAVKSDYYLSSLGHFFVALDRIGVPYSGVLVSKF